MEWNEIFATLLAGVIVLICAAAFVNHLGYCAEKYLEGRKHVKWGGEMFWLRSCLFFVTIPGTILYSLPVFIRRQIRNRRNRFATMA